MPRLSAQRAVARKLALQGLYRWQLNRCPWQDLMQDFDAAEDAPKADREFFGALVRGIVENEAQGDELLTAWCDRKASELDPIERAVLLIGVQELRAHPETPWRVAVSEAVSLAKRFGATDGHKFVNAVLDRAARELRPHEH
ncbi:MAG: transcription antitermination factor NusB [Nevskiaceae bacterium]|nr:transcription antitermination factor NusB [Nevskiaceae bacterium]